MFEPASTDSFLVVTSLKDRKHSLLGPSTRVVRPNDDARAGVQDEGLEHVIKVFLRAPSPPAVLHTDGNQVVLHHGTRRPAAPCYPASASTSASSQRP